MTPEIQTRQTINRQFAICGWIVEIRQGMTIYDGLGVGEADYLLYADGT